MSPADGLAWNEEAGGSIPTTLTSFTDPFAQQVESLSPKQVVAVRIRQGWPNYSGQAIKVMALRC
jgi:hypothetical protein